MSRFVLIVVCLVIPISGCATCGCGFGSCQTCKSSCFSCWKMKRGCNACGCRSGCSSKTNQCGNNVYSACLDDASVKQHAKKRAACSLHNYTMQSGYGPSCHFRDGFEQAYVDIAQGGTGIVPAAPPPRYWHNAYRTPDGYFRADEWYAGYRIGATMAESEGMKEYNAIPLSPSASSLAAPPRDANTAAWMPGAIQTTEGRF